MLPSVARGHVCDRELWRASLGVLAPRPPSATPRDFSESRPVHGCPILDGEPARADGLLFLPDSRQCFQ